MEQVKLSVKRVSPEEIPSWIVLKLTVLHNVKPLEFIVALDDGAKALLVNHSVPEKDIDIFYKIIMFPEDGVADPESETGDLLEYVYEKYGFETYNILIKSHDWQMDQQEALKAKKTAELIFPLIEKEVNSKKPIVKCNEWLISEIGNICKKRDYEITPKNIVGYRSIYIFYLGYLMGAGKLDEFLK